MIKNLSEAKSSLSELVQLAASGEEIVITMHGQPMARLTGISSDSTSSVSREQWAAELAAAAEAARVGEPVSTPQEFWDEIRGDRF